MVVVTVRRQVIRCTGHPLCNLGDGLGRRDPPERQQVPRLAGKARIVESPLAKERGEMNPMLTQPFDITWLSNIGQRVAAT